MISKEKLIQYYLEEDLTFEQIAKILNLSKTAICRLCKKYNIQVKPRKSISIPPKEELEKLYNADQLNTTDIASKYNICRLTLRKWFKEYNIETRDPHEPAKIPTKETLQKLYIEEGKTITEISIIFDKNRNLVSNWFEHHQIPIKMSNVSLTKPNKSLLNDMYSKGKTLEEIGDLYGVDRRSVGRWFKTYGIKTDNNKTRYENLRKVEFTQQQKEFLLGNMLGDGHLSISGTMARMFAVHCDKQKDYLFWKYEMWKNIVSIGSLEYSGKKYPCWEFTTLCHSEFLTYHKLFYNDKLKIITPKLIQHLIDYMTAFSLAILIMDDGWLSGKCIHIASDGFSKEENQLLANMFKIKFGLDTKVIKHNRHTRNKVYYHLGFDRENSAKLEEMIKPFMFPHFLYKLPSTIINRTSTTKRQTS